MQDGSADQLILVARITSPHGVRGEVRIHSFTEDPQSVSRLGVLVDRSRSQEFRFASIKSIKEKTLIGRLIGCETRTHAEKLANTDLYVRRSQLPPPEEDEFYYADLIGLEIFDVSSERLGIVEDVADYGGGCVLQTTLSARGQTYLPFTQKVVVSVDLPNKRLVVDLPTETDGENAQSNAAEDP